MSYNRSTDPLFQHFFYKHPLPCLLITADSLQIIAANNAAEIFYGRNQAQLSECYFPSLHMQIDDEQWHQLLQHLSEEQSNSFTQFSQKDDKLLTIEVFASPLVQDGAAYYQITIITDRQEVKTKEEQLQYQAILLENVSDIIVTTDTEFRIQSFNKAAEQCYGYKEADVKGKWISSILQFTYHQTTKEEAFAELTQNGIWRGEVSFCNKQGQWNHFLHTVKYIYDKESRKVGVISIGRDITNRKSSEQKMLESELFYRNLIADALDAILVTDASGLITFVSPSIKNVLGYETDEVLGRNCFQFVHIDDQLWASQSFQREVVENPEIKFIVVRLLKKTGEWLWCMVRGHNLLNNPHVQGIVIYFHDDSPRKNANDALKESEQRFRKLVQNLQFGVMMQDADGRVIMCNEALLQILQLKEEELVGKNVVETISDAILEDGTIIKSEDLPFLKIINTKDPIRNTVIGIFHPRLGDRKWILVNSDPVLDEANHLMHVICSIKDITDRKKLEQQLLHEQMAQQKLLTQATIDGQERERREIGKELHDNIGQQLTTTKLYLELAKGTADHSTSEMICMALQRISDVINEVRTLSHSLVPPTLGDLGLIESVYDLIETISYTQPLAIHLDCGFFDEKGIPENQKLMVFRIIQEQTNNIIKHAQATSATIILRQEEQQLTLEIKDNGKGFDIKNVRKGVGLANIKSRAELFGGKAEVFSSVGLGCTLKVIIPRIRQPQL